MPSATTITATLMIMRMYVNGFESLIVSAKIVSERAWWFRLLFSFSSGGSAVGDRVFLWNAEVNVCNEIVKESDFNWYRVTRPMPGNETILSCWPKFYSDLSPDVYNSCRHTTVKTVCCSQSVSRFDNTSRGPSRRIYTWVTTHALATIISETRYPIIGWQPLLFRVQQLRNPLSQKVNHQSASLISLVVL